MPNHTAPSDSASSHSEAARKGLNSERPRAKRPAPRKKPPPLPPMARRDRRADAKAKDESLAGSLGRATADWFVARWPLLVGLLAAGLLAVLLFAFWRPQL